MADREVDFLLVGGGPAGAACAAELRRRGAGGTILLVGRELDEPYERPPASKSYLRGESTREEASLHAPGWYAEQGIELLTRTSVMKLDTAERRARLSTREEIAYDRALVATGANVRRLRIDGSDLDGIHYLRTLPNSDAIREDVEAAERVVLVGGSYIACEVAASLTVLGKRCTMVMEEPAPLSRGFGADAGRYFAEVLGSHGVEVVGGDAVARFEGEGRIARVVTASGRAVEADAVVMGTGVVPDVMLARGAGLALGASGGVACDDRLRTSAAGVWGAGDVCEYESVVHGRRLRVEHWEVALAQGKAVAADMLGAGRPFDEVPYFWSDLADWCTLEYVGPTDVWDREVVRGSYLDGAFTIFYLHEQRLVAALTVGRPEDLMTARRLVHDGGELEERSVVALGDPAADLDDVTA